MQRNSIGGEAGPAGGALPADDEAVLPIRTVSARTGVNPVTLRAWERRYGLVRPQRTPKGHRLYSHADVDKIRRVLLLLERGIPISQVRKYLEGGSGTPAAPAGEAAAAPAPEAAWEQHLQRLRRTLEALDDRGLDSAYNEVLSLYPLDLVAERLLRPLRRGLAGGAQAALLEAFLTTKLCARFQHLSGQADGPRLLAVPYPEVASPDALVPLCQLLTLGLRVTLLAPRRPLTALGEAVRGRPLLLLFGDPPGLADEPGLEAEAGQLAMASPLAFSLGAPVPGAVHLPGRVQHAAELLRERLVGQG